MPISDMDLKEAWKLFNLKVWSYAAVTQAFLPFLTAAKGMAVNLTSLTAMGAHPLFWFLQLVNGRGRYVVGHEFAPFDIQVVKLKTSTVKSRITEKEALRKLPQCSPYEPAKVEIEKHVQGAEAVNSAFERGSWAEKVVQDLLKKKPPAKF